MIEDESIENQNLHLLNLVQSGYRDGSNSYQDEDDETIRKNEKIIKDQRQFYAGMIYASDEDENDIPLPEEDDFFDGNDNTFEWDEDTTVHSINKTSKFQEKHKMYQIKTNINENISRNDKLYEGCSFSICDLSRLLLYIKSSKVKIGQILLSVVLGTVVTFLPPNSLIRQELKTCDTSYLMMKFLMDNAQLSNDLKTYKLSICKKGCSVFKKKSYKCKICRGVKFKFCSKRCVRNQKMLCNHLRVPSEYCFYLSVRDRIKKLLNSDLRNLFFYDKYRYKSSNESYVEDIFDGSVYKSFKNFIPVECNLIFLQVCWDGASMFTFGKSNQEMWPLIYSIVNFPP